MLFTGFSLLTVGQEGITKVLISTLQVSPHTSGRLSGELDTILKDRDWEIVSGHRCQVEAEVTIDIILLIAEVDDNSLK